MSNISSWSTTAASNNSAAPNGAPEGMAPSGVNDVIRENMAATAKWYAALAGGLVTTGSSNAYVLSTGSSHAALANIGLVVFRANFTNTATATLAVDGLTAKTLKSDGGALAAGQIVQNQLYAAVYNATNDCFDMVNAQVDLSSLSSPVLSSRTSNTELGTADVGKFIKVTSGTFTQTFAAAATLGSGWFVYYYNAGTGVVTLDPNSTETIDGSSTRTVVPGEVLLIQSDGSNLNVLPIQSSIGTHEVTVHTGNGHGSTNTKIRRFTTAMTETGSAITYADSSTNGATFTISEAGLYSISYSDKGSTGCYIGVSVGSAALTTSVQSIAVATRYALVQGGSATTVSCSAVIRLASGDVVRAHTDAGPDDTSDNCYFTIKKIGL